MNILQFESLNLEFICKTYEINKFLEFKIQNRSNSVIKQKATVLSVKLQGSARETEGRRVESQKDEGFFNKKTTQRGIGSRQPFGPQSTDEIRSAGERVGAGGRARLTGGTGKAATWVSGADRPGPMAGGTGEGRI
jgi:hypothetical protein